MNRFARRRDNPAGPTATNVSPPVLLQGDEPYEVACDPAQQEALWKATGVRRGTPVMLEIRAVLVPEWINGAATIGVHIAGRRIGALAPDDSAALLDGLRAVMERNHSDVAVRGRLVSGAATASGDKRQLNVWVYLDPIDFGFDPPALEAVRTGHSVAADERWADALPADHAERVRFLRKQLDNENAPLQRHLMYNSLEEALFHIRDSGPLAFDEFEAAVAAHDAEMSTILPALLDEFGGVPELPAYARLARMLARRHRVGEALRWATRGLELYGQHGTNAAAVEDLRNWAAVFSRAAGRPMPTNASMLAAPANLTLPPTGPSRRLDAGTGPTRREANPALQTSIGSFAAPVPAPVDHDTERDERHVVDTQLSHDVANDADATDDTDDDAIWVDRAGAAVSANDVRRSATPEAADESGDRGTSDGPVDPDDDPADVDVDVDVDVEVAPAAAPPAWYPDPTGRASMRFWDGARWTQHVSTDGRPGIDLLD